jgi:hypothetical protein
MYSTTEEIQIHGKRNENITESVTPEPRTEETEVSQRRCNKQQIQDNKKVSKT